MQGRKAPTDAQGTGGAAVTTAVHCTAQAEHTNCAGGHGPIPNVGGYRGGGGATSRGGSKQEYGEGGGKKEGVSGPG